jgi:hypothetical protein
MTNQVILKSRRAGSLWRSKDEHEAILKFEREMQEKMMQHMWELPVPKKKRIRRKQKAKGNKT